MICPIGKDWDVLVSTHGKKEALRLFVDNDYEVPIVVNETISEALPKIVNSDNTSQAVNTFLSDVKIKKDDLTTTDDKDIAKAIGDLLIKIESGDIATDHVDMLVSLAKDNPALQIITKNIDKFSQYDSNLNTKENLIKLFTNIIEGEKELDKSATRSEQLTNAWNGMLKAVKAKLNAIPKSTVALFSELFPKNVLLKDKSKTKVDKQLQEEIKSKLLTEHNRLELIDTNNQHYYMLDGKHKVSKSVTERTSKVDPERVDGIKSEFSKNIGIKSHDLMQDLVNKILAGNKNISLDQHMNKLGAAAVTRLVSYMEQFKLQFPEGSEFLSELKVYNKAKDEAGSVDLVVVLPDGTMEIFDWKFQMFSKQDEERGTPSFYKEKNWNIQLQAYRDIISMQIKNAKFGKTRIIPAKIINETYLRPSDNKRDFIFKGFEIGGYIEKDGKVVTTGQDFLDAVPVNDEPLESDQLNNLVDKLSQLREDAVANKETTKEGQEIRLHKIKTISKAIQKIRTKRDLSNFVSYAATELKSIESKLENKSLTELKDELMQDLNILDFLINSENILYDDDVVIDDKTKESLLNIRSKAKSAKLKIEPMLKDIAVSIATDNGLGSNIFVAKEMSSLQKLFQGLSQSENKIIQSFYRLVRDSKEKTRNQVETLIATITEKKKTLESWAARNGLSGMQMYSKLLQYGDDGKPTGRLLTKTDKQFWIAKKEAINRKDHEWVMNNVEFDSVRFEEYKARSIERINNTFYSADEQEDKKIKYQKIKEIDINYNPHIPNVKLLNTKALLNEKNWFLNPLSKWDSAQWQDLNKSENRELREFYEFFTNTVKELSEDLPVDLKTNAIPSIEKNLIEAIFEGNLSGSTAKNIKYSFWDSISYNSRMDENHLDEDGNPKKTIPLYYIDQLGSNKEDAERKSYDLAKVLAMYGKMAYNYANMSKIEGSTRILRKAMESQKIINTSQGGRAIINKITSKVAGNVAKADDLEIFDDYINYELYGIKVKDKESTFTKTVQKEKVDENGDVVTDEDGNVIMESYDKEYSWNRILKKSMRYFSNYSLAFNTVSAVANFTGGLGNSFVQATKGKFFTKSQLANSVYKLATNDKNYVGILNHLDVMKELFIDDRIKDLSASTPIKLNKSNYLYKLQHMGDSAIHQLVAASMLQNYTIIDGSLQQKKATDKSIIEQLASTTASELLPKDSKVYSEFRAKTQALTERIMGMSSRSDISRVKMHMLGQTLMHFRSWIPRTIEDRLGKLRYNYDLESWEKGRMLSTVELLFNRNFLGNMQDFIIGTKSNATSTAQKLYQDALRKDPTLEISEDEFVQLHLENLRAMRAEIGIALAFWFTFISQAQIEDDDDELTKTLKTKWLAHANRMYDELSFYINLNSTMDIIKSPIPLSGLYMRFINIIGDGLKVPLSAIDPDQDFAEASKKLAEDVVKVTPIFSQTFRWLDE